MHVVPSWYLRLNTQPGRLHCAFGSLSWKTKKEKRFLEQGLIPIYPSSSDHPVQGHRGLGPNLTAMGREAGYTLERSPVGSRTNTETDSHSH